MLGIVVHIPGWVHIKINRKFSLYAIHISDWIGVKGTEKWVVITHTIMELFSNSFFVSTFFENVLLRILLRKILYCELSTTSESYVCLGYLLLHLCAYTYLKVVSAEFDQKMFFSFIIIEFVLLKLLMMNDNFAVF